MAREPMKFKAAPKTDDPTDVNLAKKLPLGERKKIAQQIVQEFDFDRQTRKPWEDRRNRCYKLWMGERAKKETPFPGASNVCLPLLASAANQFSARGYQALFAPPGLAKTLPVGDSDVQRARKVEKFMNWQFLYDIEDYEDGKDKLLLNLPIGGTNFDKIYYDHVNDRPVVDYCSGIDVMLPYRTKNLRTARRITHAIPMHYDHMKLRADDKIWIDFAKVSSTSSHGFEADSEIEDTKDMVEGTPVDFDDRPKWVLERHMLLKTSIDSKPHPYILTVDYDSQTLMRMTSREMKLDHVPKPVVPDYFVDYHFIPNPEGYYSFGFGHFLEQLNEMANTTFNQIFDAGKITNQPFGFYGRRAGLKRKEIKLWPGKMEEVDDASQIYFPNMQRLDQTLFQVLGFIQQYSEQFTSTSDYLMGREAKGTKTPTASGTLAIIEQGLVLFGVLTKRTFRSLRRELQLIYGMNQLFLSKEKQFRVGEDEDIPWPSIKREDFDGKVDIIVQADPTYASRSLRIEQARMKYQDILNNPLTGVHDPRVQIANPVALAEATRDLLESYGTTNIGKYIPKMPDMPMSPIQENALFYQGDTHDPIPGDNDIEHIATHEAFKDSTYGKAMSEERRANLQKHIDKHKAKMYQEVHARIALAGQPMPPGLPSGLPGGGAPQAEPGTEPPSGPEGGASPAIAPGTEMMTHG